MRTLLLLSIVLSSACVVGSGHQVTASREVEPFRRISVEAGIKVHGTTGSRAVTVTADDNIIDLVETVVNGGVLQVKFRPGTLMWQIRRVQVELSNDLYEGVEASGGSDVELQATAVEELPVSASGGSRVELTGVSATRVTVDASGASKVSLSGVATRGVAHASGASKVRLDDLPLGEELKVDASGASSVSARVSSTLTGTASGVSNVSVVGSPSNAVDVSGASSVRLNER